MLSPNNFSERGASAAYVPDLLTPSQHRFAKINGRLSSSCSVSLDALFPVPTLRTTHTHNTDRQRTSFNGSGDGWVATVLPANCLALLLPFCEPSTRFFFCCRLSLHSLDALRPHAQRPAHGRNVGVHGKAAIIGRVQRHGAFRYA